MSFIPVNPDGEVSSWEYLLQGKTEAEAYERFRGVICHNLCY
jgi:hypothetical protein